MSDITKCKVCGKDDVNADFQNIWHYDIGQPTTMERLCLDCFKWKKELEEELEQISKQRMKEINGQKRRGSNKSFA